MSTETVIERDPPEELRRGAGEIRMAEGDERDILAGAAEMAGEPVGDVEELEALQERLMGYRLNSEREAAWVRRLVLPGESVEGAEVAEEEVGVEFMLPSGNTFWRTYALPDRRWPDDNAFVQLLDHLGHNPSTLDEIAGDRVDVTYVDGEWRLVGVEVDEDGVRVTDHAREWDEREPTTGPVLDDEDDSAYLVAAVATTVAAVFTLVDLPLDDVVLHSGSRWEGVCLQRSCGPVGACVSAPDRR